MYSVVETATLPDHILDKTEYHVELFPQQDLRAAGEERQAAQPYYLETGRGHR